MNATLLSVGGLDAVSAMTVQGNVCSFAGAFPSGIGGTTMIMSSIYYGEDDQVSMKELLKYSLKVGIILTAVVSGVIMIGSGPIASVFYQSGSSVWLLTRRMLIIFPVFLVFNAIFNIFVKIYQSQGQMVFTNAMSVAENLVMAGIAFVLSPLLGCDAVWMSFTLSDLLCILAIAISVFIKTQHITFRPEDWLKLDKGAIADPEDRMAISVHSVDDVINISERVVKFCQNKGLDHRKCTIAGLCVEEMAGNIVSHGFSKDNKKHSVDIRLAYKNGEIVLRMRDDCTAFDPKSRMEQFTPEDPVKNAGIRLIGKMATDMDYQNNLGLNILTIKI